MVGMETGRGTQNRVSTSRKHREKRLQVRTPSLAPAFKTATRDFPSSRCKVALSLPPSCDNWMAVRPWECLDPGQPSGHFCFDKRNFDLLFFFFFSAFKPHIENQGQAGNCDFTKDSNIWFKKRIYIISF